MHGSKIVGIVSAIVASGTFGLIPLFSIPLMQAGMGETSVLFYRCLIAATALGFICLAKGKETRISLADGLRLAGLALLNCTTSTALLLSYGYISSGVVTTIHFLYPVIVALLMAWLYREKCSAGIIVAALVTLVGVGSVSWTGNGFINARGVLLALSTAFSYAFYMIALNHRTIRGMDSGAVMFYILLFSSVVFGVMSLTTGGIDTVPGGGAWLNLLLLALLPTIVSNMALLKAIRYAGPTTTSVLGSAEPLVAVLFGVSVFSETLTPAGILGLMMIVAAVTYVILKVSGRQTYA